MYEQVLDEEYGDSDGDSDVCDEVGGIAEGGAANNSVGKLSFSSYVKQTNPINNSTMIHANNFVEYNSHV